jgi:hypothetical protein
VCQLLHDLLSDRDLWIKILRAVCQRDGIFSGTYPVADMDLGQIQLAAVRSKRWRKLIRRNAISSSVLFAAERIQPVHPGRSWPIGAASVYAQKHLVPGGRFLITFSEGQPSDAASTMKNVVLQVYDLGPPGVTSRNARFLVSYPFKTTAQGEKNVRSAFCTLGDSTLRVVIVNPIGGGAMPFQTS